ncbi:hypothetical protein EV688_11032 [Chromatocurvus halotolerans]|uniref:Uncharacterized protein n=1 Tax=Chromatocurvus halotolerans TaxID=1132028 RepID=A0A4V2SBD3_9GAMM|nr:hypothetical protein EV688_11032 [Chromatocurvus halotolerans]
MPQALCPGNTHNGRTGAVFCYQKKRVVSILVIKSGYFHAYGSPPPLFVGVLPGGECPRLDGRDKGGESPLHAVLALHEVANEAWRAR